MDQDQLQQVCIQVCCKEPMITPVKNVSIFNQKTISTFHIYKKEFLGMRLIKI